MIGLPASHRIEVADGDSVPGHDRSSGCNDEGNVGDTCGPMWPPGLYVENMIAGRRADSRLDGLTGNVVVSEPLSNE